MTPPATHAPWGDVEACARHDLTLVLTGAQCARLVEWHNQVVGAKNDLVRENWALRENLRALENTLDKVRTCQ